MGTCDDLIAAPLKIPNAEPRSKLLERDQVTDDFWHFVQPWLRRAALKSDNGNSFEAFIFLWVAFNGWATLVVKNEYTTSDNLLVSALALDPVFAQRFQDSKSDSDFALNTATLASLLPIFKLRSLRTKDIKTWDRNSQRRKDYINYALHNPNRAVTKSDYYPSCYLDHENTEFNEAGITWHGIPNDWPHILWGIYQIRCNLFHGSKTNIDEHHRLFVEYAYNVLTELWNEEIPDRWRPSSSIPRKQGIHDR